MINQPNGEGDDEADGESDHDNEAEDEEEDGDDGGEDKDKAQVDNEGDDESDGEGEYPQLVIADGDISECGLERGNSWDNVSTHFILSWSLLDG
jgi:hypothetical protein